MACHAIVAPSQTIDGDHRAGAARTMTVITTKSDAAWRAPVFPFPDTSGSSGCNTAARNSVKITMVGFSTCGSSETTIPADNKATDRRAIHGGRDVSGTRSPCSR